MLMLTRRHDEEVVICLEDGRRITVKVIDLQQNRRRVRIGFDGPKTIRIYRREIMDLIDAEAERQG